MKITVYSFVKRLVRDVSALPDEMMRIGLLCRRLSGLKPQDAAIVLDAIYNEKTSRLSGYMMLQTALVDHKTLIELIGIEKINSIYHASIELGLERVSRFFTDLPPCKSAPFGYTNEEDAKMEIISLGERRAMSKRWDKDALDRLLSDPDPMVIMNILNNPRITEREVVKIASKRPNSQEILRLISVNKRWGRRYNVRKAIAENPYTSPRIAVGIVEFLLLQDLKEIADDTAIHPQVRGAARALIEKKKTLQR